MSTANCLVQGFKSIVFGALVLSATATVATAAQGPVAVPPTTGAAASGNPSLPSGGPAGASVLPTDKSCVAKTEAYEAMAASFAADPKKFLDEFTAHGASVAVPVRNVLVITPTAIDIMIEQMKAGSAELGRQIAVGIGQATVMCTRNASDISLAFQERMAAIDNAEMLAAYAAATGESATGALRGISSPPATATRGAPAIQASPGIGTVGPVGEVAGVPQTVESYVWRNTSPRALFRTRSTATIVSPSTP